MADEPTTDERLDTHEARLNMHSQILSALAAKAGIPLPVESQEGGEDGTG